MFTGVLVFIFLTKYMFLISQAGISTDKLTIALEPEAASIFCRHLSVETTVSGGNISIAKMSVGTRYMILDAGGRYTPPKYVIVLIPFSHTIHLLLNAVH